MDDWPADFIERAGAPPFVFSLLRGFRPHREESGEDNPASRHQIRPREPFSDIAEQEKLLAWCNRPTWSPAEGKERVLPPHPKTPTFLKLLLLPP